MSDSDPLESLTGNEDERPAAIGRYQIRRELGRGMMGVVYEAVDALLGRTVALKTIRLAFVVTPAERATFEERFFTEARIAARLSHPGIVVVHDIGKDEHSGLLYIVLEYLKGRTLGEMTASRQPLYWRDALQIVAKLARALHHAHAHGVIHRDIKPANVMVLDNGEPKVMDFGIAKIETARIRLTAAGQSLGSPLYMSPEQALGEDVGASSDLFSLGSILYTLLTGSSPFVAASIPSILSRILREDPLPPSFSVAGLPRDVDAIVARALAKRTAERYARGDLLAEDIEDVLSERSARHAGGARTAPDTVETAMPSAAAPPPLNPLDELSALVDEALVRVEAPPGKAPAEASTGATYRAPSDRRWARLVLPLALLVVITLGGLYVLMRRTAQPATERPDLVDGRGETGTAGTVTAAPSPARQGPGGGVIDAARLAIHFEHPIRTGTFRLWIDDELKLERMFSGRPKKLLAVTAWSGEWRQTVDVRPGRRALRVQVRWDDNERTELIEGVFVAGETRAMDVGVGRLRKDLSLDWR
jgi:serine/threonine-protein kinase